MKIFLKDIPDEGLALESSLAAEEIGLAEPGFSCLTPLEIQAQFDKTDTELYMQIEVAATYQLNCARCLDPVRQERSDAFELIFDITPETEFVEWGEDVRQELLLRLLGVVRCREDCKGLCPTCGVNLNQEKCKCKKVTRSQGLKVTG